MNYKHCCVVDADGSYKTFVLVLLEQSEGSKTTESVQGYTLTAGERLIDTAPPTKREHAGTAGFVKPRWDENGETWLEGSTDEELAAWEVGHPDPVPLEDKRAAKHAEISAANELAIYAGIDVETTQGAEHFSLTDKDQINLAVAKNAVDCGDTEHLYHADGKEYRSFTADEIRKISQAAMDHIMRCNIYCNHVFAWINESNSSELDAIVYGSSLPEHFSNNIKKLLNG